MQERNAAQFAAGVQVARELVCCQASRTWRRNLGALAWVTLKELALTSRRDDRGWASPTGIRTIAAATETAAVRAIAAPGRTGLVSFDPVLEQDGQRCCHYRLYLPPGIELRKCPSERDNVELGLCRHVPNNQDALSPSRQDCAEISCEDKGFPAGQDGLVPIGGDAKGAHQESRRLPEPLPHDRCSGSHSEEQS